MLKNWKNGKKAGDCGEIFADQHLEKIIGENFPLKNRLGSYADSIRKTLHDEDLAKHVESIGGEDIFAVRSEKEFGIVPMESEELRKKVRMPTKPCYIEYRSLRIVEIKTICGSFLWQYNNYRCPCGSVGFELWNTAKTENGWLEGYLYPDTKKGYVQGDLQSGYLTPTHLIYVFTLDNAGGQPICTICFSWEELAVRLNELSGHLLQPEYKIPMPQSEKWKTDDRYKKFDKWILRNDHDVRGNMWHVPLEEIVDLARIVLFNIPADEELMRISEKNKNADFYLMKQRLSYIMENAAVLPDTDLFHST